MFCIRFYFSRRPHIDSLHGPARPRHRQSRDFAGFEMVRGVRVRVARLVVAVRHARHARHGALLLLATVHHATAALRVFGHDGEYREARRKFREFGRNGGGVGDVGAADRRVLRPGGLVRSRELGSFLGTRHRERFYDVGVREGADYLGVGEGFGDVGVAEERLVERRRHS